MNVISTTRYANRFHCADDAFNTSRRGGAMLLPGFRFGDLGPDIQREQRGQRADPEHRTPAPKGSRKRAAIAASKYPIE